MRFVDDPTEDVRGLAMLDGEQADRALGAAVICNDGTGTPRFGNYHIALRNGARGRVREVQVLAFPRCSKSAWELLRRALNTLHDEGNLP